MSDELIVLKTFSREIDARLAQQVLQESGIRSLVFKDDVGGMEPHLQLTAGIRLVVMGVDAECAHQLLNPKIS